MTSDPAAVIAISAIAATVLAVLAAHGFAVNRAKLRRMKDSLGFHYLEINDE